MGLFLVLETAAKASNCRVPHLRRSFIAPKVGNRAEHDPFLRVESVGIFAAAKMAHLSDDKTVAKMGHPIVVVRSDVGHPPDFSNSNRLDR